ncbi:MAG TPA: protealysin inhibitor emfourin, partial [Thermoanaerobaculia bacterium]|nr:protealysin inhibitor emfourin [Thermoanaerobaculia bacterium]
TIAVRRSPDRFRYTLTVEEEGRQSRVTLAEEEMPERLRPLLDALWSEGDPGSKPPGAVTA